MIEVIDLSIDAHKEKCTRCRLYALCAEGRRIVKAQGTAILKAASGTWRRPS